MRVFSNVMDGNRVRQDEIVHDLGITINHNGKCFTISEDNNGKLTLRSIDNVSIVILPQASNTVQIRSE
jgi:hypothetical protein